MREGRSSETGDHDLVIHGGLVVDGTGGPPRPADVAVSDGKVTEVWQYWADPYAADELFA